jgi:tRNA threonylcarbamoyladenosine biosynthesis protein TsaE
MATFISHSPEQTEALGLAWGRAAESGLVIGLCGELGAGKTQLVKGLARGLGSPVRVQSPSFVLVNVYTGGRLNLFHLDLYRLETPRQILAAGLEEYLAPDGVTVIEWADKLNLQPPASSLPPSAAAVPAPSGLLRRTGHPPSSIHSPCRWAVIEVVGETERRITYEDFGA